MSLDTTILSILAEKEQHDKLISSIPLHAFDEKTQILIKDFSKYYKEFEHVKIIPQTFETWFFTFLHPTIKEEQKMFYTKLFSNIFKPVDTETKKGIIARLLELEFATNIANICNKYDIGDDIDIQRAIDEQSDTLKINLDRKTSVPWVRDSILDLLDEQGESSGLTWRLQCLNESMRPLRQGDFGIIAGRPDTGKTTFITSELTFMASQLKKFYKEDDKIITWFNNEGQGKRIITRLYQSALNASISELLDLKKQGSIVQEYKKVIGNIDTIRIFDIHDAWSYDVIDILDTVNTGLIVFDMIDNIKFSTLNGTPNTRTDQVLEAMYQWARILGVNRDCPVLATSQISAEGDGMQFPTLSMLKDSKTGKQGACDFQLMLGKSNEVGMENSRFIGLPKNKLAVEGFPKDPRCEVIFNGLKARYIMPKVQ